MNTIRDVKVRIQDFTTPAPLRRKGLATVTDSGGLFFAFRAAQQEIDATPMPRIRRIIG